MIKPLPLHIRKYLSKKKIENFQNGDLEGSSSDGDEMFLDREVTLGQDQISTNGFPLDSQNKGSISHPHHVVFRRQSSDNSDLRFSDFGKINILYVHCLPLLIIVFLLNFTNSFSKNVFSIHGSW